MALLRIIDVCLRYSRGPLLDHVNISIESSGEKIALLGRNGAGKSSLFKIITGVVQPDKGSIEYPQDIKIAHLEQSVPSAIDQTIYEVVASGLKTVGELLSKYQRLISDENIQNQPGYLAKLENLQQQIEVNQGWHYQQKIQALLSKMSLNGNDNFTNLSGGMKRRVWLARALVLEPDILLLDEPTNHLDIEAVIWLESLLKQLNITIIFISHDRKFIENIANKILDLDRGKLTVFDCNYQNYLTRKEKFLETQEKENKLFDKNLKQEEAWIRQGIKARRTRNEGRVRALKDLRKQRAERVDRQGKAQIALNQSSKSGKKVISAKNLTAKFDDKVLYQNFSIEIERGDKIGLVGPNGCGKTTLVKQLLKKNDFGNGEVVHGTELTIAYFDQYQEHLDENLSVRDNVSGGSDWLTINNKNIHVMSYLQDFLFSPEQANGKISALSGGERNRLLLAKLFVLPANLLVLDEPTNDLDIETLELLEEQLMNYDGTVLLITHDRTFLNNVVSSTIVFSGNGQINEIVGGYDDLFAEQSKTPAVTNNTKQEKQEKKSNNKLSYKERKELESLPNKIEQIEQEIADLHETLASPEFYQESADNIVSVKQKLQDLEQLLDDALSRWEALELKDK